MRRINATAVAIIFLVGVVSQLALGGDFVPRAIEPKPDAFADGLGHVQGICCDEDAIYAILANRIYKFDWEGKVVKSEPVVFHAGDPCVANGKLYVSMSSEDQNGVYEYDLELNLLRKIKLEGASGTDGIAFLDGKFYVGGPSDAKAHLDNLICVYDSDFKLVEQKLVNYDTPTNYGTQSIAAWNGKLFLAFYIDDATKGSSPSVCCDAELNVLGKTFLDGSTGWCLAPESKQSNDPEKPRFLVCRWSQADGKRLAKFVWFDFDPKTMKFEDATVK
ncbi:MAG: hypothetical protein IJM30_11090 [Thermoguttaceae bacterium]|nr:hypothetical protein [Thermoguttaceae bacterium]